MNSRPYISIIIVNYNTRGFILLVLESLLRAINDFDAEIIVVDNASGDDSIEQVRQYYPEVIIIQNSDNIGFAAANNIGLRRAKGEFVLLLNPDTVIAEDSFNVLLKFMHQTPGAGAVGCKILNADGSFSVDSRHSVPSPLTALWKQLGLQRLFPGSKVFGRYNLTYLDPDETYPVDAISGSFMFLRRDALEQAGLLDEDYFMYGEDVDYCYRLMHAGWKIYYCPQTAIIHFKGESTARNSIRYSWNFSHSLYLFYTKHFRHRYGYLMSGIVLLGVLLRVPLIYVRQGVRNIFIHVRQGLSRDKKKKVIWVGSSGDLLRSQALLSSSGYRIDGMITGDVVDEKDVIPGIPVLGTVQELSECIPSANTDGLIFSAGDLSYKFIIKTISDLHKWKLDNKILLTRSMTIIGKSSR
jgi:GT2 family glycosyltransferase